MSNFFLQPNSSTAQSTQQGVTAYQTYAQQKARQVAQTVGWGTLGSITKSQSTFSDYEKENLPTKQETRKNLFSLKNESAKLLPSHRVNGCLCNRVHTDKMVGVNVKTTTNTKTKTTERKATFKNLFRCDSVWVCPVCAQRILAQRGKEIEKAIDKQLDNGHSVFMLTLTHSHTKDDELKDKLKRMGKALSRFFGDRAVQYVFNQFGMQGHIKALEFTHSFANGWHPHNHILMFSKLAKEQFESDLVSVYFDDNGFIKVVTPYIEKQLIKKKKDHLIELVTIEQFIKHYWRKCCLAVGLGEPSYERGATLQDADKAKSYLTKFKTAHEMTNANAKKGKGSSRNQWQLLADAMNGDLIASKLFQEYAEATHGQRQLVWSRGLKDLFNIEQVDDSDCPDHQDDQAEIIVSEDEIYFTDEQWFFIKRRKLQPELLNLAETHGIDAVKDFLQTLPTTAIPVQLDPSLAVMRM